MTARKRAPKKKAAKKKTAGRKKTPAKKKVARKKTSRKERPEATVAPGVLTVSLGGFGFEEEVWAPDEVDLTAILKAGRSGKIPDLERSNTDFHGIFLNSGRLHVELVHEGPAPSATAHAGSRDRSKRKTTVTGWNDEGHQVYGRLANHWKPESALRWARRKGAVGTVSIDHSIHDMSDSEILLGHEGSWEADAGDQIAKLANRSELSTVESRSLVRRGRKLSRRAPPPKTPTRSSGSLSAHYMLIVKGTFCSFTTCADKFKFSKLEFPVASSIEGDLYLDYEIGLTYESQAMELNWNKELWWAKHAILIVRASDQLIYHSDHTFNEARFLEAAESA